MLLKGDVGFYAVYFSDCWAQLVIPYQRPVSDFSVKLDAAQYSGSGDTYSETDMVGQYIEPAVVTF